MAWRKRTKGNMPELAPIVAAKAHPRDRRGIVMPKPEDARLTALTARCHHIGKPPDKAGRAAAAAPMLGCDIGRAMHAMHAPDDAARLWAVWQAWCQAEERFSARIIGIRTSPANAALPMLPEPVEVDRSLSADIRDPDEKDIAARRAHEHWQGILANLPRHDAKRLQMARREVSRALWSITGPTVEGQLTVKALARLADAVEG